MDVLLNGTRRIGSGDFLSKDTANISKAYSLYGIAAHLGLEVV
jgi:hypothetical protein